MVDLGDGHTVEADSIETSGIEHSADGDVAVPADNLDDLEDMFAENPYDIPHKDPKFHYQLIRKDQLSYYISRFHAIVVTKDEFGIPEEMQKEYGRPQTTAHEMFDAIYIKIPKEVAVKREKQKIRLSHRNLEALEPDEDTIRRAKEQGFEVRTKFNSTVKDRARRK